MDRIENRPFDEINVGDTARLVRTLTFSDIELFAIVSGDVNPMHVDAEFAKDDLFHGLVAHGMWGGALISTLLGTELPGPGTVYVEQSLRFRRPIKLGDTVTVGVEVVEKIIKGHRLVLECTVCNQEGEIVISGKAQVIAPLEKISRERMVLPRERVARALGCCVSEDLA